MKLSSKDRWFASTWHEAQDDDMWPVPGNWQMSIRRFFQRGLTEHQISEAVAITAHSQAPSEDKWRYFCGVCWNMVNAHPEVLL